MDTRHLVDPELVPILDQVPTFPLTMATLPQARAAFAEWLARLEPSLPADSGIAVEERHVPGPAGAPDVRVLDLFLEENLEYARRLARAGVPTELHVYPGGYHAFNLLVADARVSRDFDRDYLDALGRGLGLIDRPAADAPHA
jgi:acetyl esterase/lipase